MNRMKNTIHLERKKERLQSVVRTFKSFINQAMNELFVPQFDELDVLMVGRLDLVIYVIKEKEKI